MFRYPQPKQCDDCMHRCGTVQEPSHPYFGDSYCVTHKRACYEWFEWNEECPDFLSKYPEDRPKESKYRPTKASLDGFVEGL